LESQKGCCLLQGMIKTEYF